MLLNNVTFWGGMSNQRKHHEIKLLTTEKRSNYLVSEPNFKVFKLILKKKSK